MNHKHIQVIIDHLEYSQGCEAQEAINDLVDYVECAEEGKTDEHYERCILS